MVWVNNYITSAPFNFSFLNSTGAINSHLHNWTSVKMFMKKEWNYREFFCSKFINEKSYGF